MLGSLSAGDPLTVGRPDFQMNLPSEDTADDFSTLSRTKVAATGTNSITIGVDAVDEYKGLETLVGKQAAGDYNKKKFADGMYLYYRPDLHLIDPWPVRHEVDFEADKLSTLFKALFGDTSEIVVSERAQADHIPMGFDDGTFTSFIDWDTFGTMAAALAEVEEE